MVINTTILAIVIVAGVIVAFGGYNLFRYSIIIMGGVGGFFLGNDIFNNYLSDMIGDGIFRAMSGSKGASFVIAVFMLATIALAYFLYKIMAPVIAAVGAGYMFGVFMMLTPGAGYGSYYIGFILGLLVGAIAGLVAVQFENIAAIIFTAVCGGRIIAYAAAKLLVTTDIGTKIGTPLTTLFSTTDASQALEMAIFLELFIAVAIIGTVVQLFTRVE